MRQVFVVVSKAGTLLRRKNGARAVFSRRKDAETYKRQLLKAGVTRGFAQIERVYVHDPRVVI